MNVLICGKSVEQAMFLGWLDICNKKMTSNSLNYYPKKMTQQTLQYTITNTKKTKPAKKLEKNK